MDAHLDSRENRTTDHAVPMRYPHFMVGGIPIGSAVPRVRDSIRGRYKSRGEKIFDAWFQAPVDQSAFPRVALNFGTGDSRRVNLESLEVHDGGRRIRFHWHDLIPVILHDIYRIAET